MPILALEETDRAPQPIRLGHIRGGVTATSRGGKTYPKATESIVLTASEETWLRPLARDYGGEIERYMPQGQTEPAYRVVTESDFLLGLLMFADREANLEQFMEAYVKGGLSRRCDGRTCTQITVDEETGEVEGQDVPCICAATGKDECKPSSRIRLMLPQTGVGGWQLHTPSKTAAVALRDDLLTMQGLFGHLNGLPVRLTYLPRKFRRGTTNRVWRLELAAAVPRVLDAMASKYPLRATVDLALGGSGAPALPAGELQTAEANTEHGSPSGDGVSGAEYQAPPSEEPSGSEAPKSRRTGKGKAQARSTEPSGSEDPPAAATTTETEANRSGGEAAAEPTVDEEAGSDHGGGSSSTSTADPPPASRPQATPEDLWALAREMEVETPEGLQQTFGMWKLPEELAGKPKVLDAWRERLEAERDDRARKAARAR